MLLTSLLDNSVDWLLSQAEELWSSAWMQELSALDVEKQMIEAKQSSEPFIANKTCDYEKFCE